MKGYLITAGTVVIIAVLFYLLDKFTKRMGDGDEPRR
jgi:hypothetical protein